MPSKRKTPTKKHTKAKKPQPSCKQRVLAWNDAAGVWLNKHPRRALAYGVGGIIAVFLLSQLIGSVYNRYAFMYVQKNLSTMSAEIAKETNPTKTWSEDYCRRQSVKYGKGALSCTVKRWAYYKDVSLEDTKSTIDRINSLFRERYKTFREVKTPTYAGNILYAAKVDTRGLDCYVYYTHNDASTNVIGQSDEVLETGYGLFLELACDGSAAHEYFPIQH